MTLDGIDTLQNHTGGAWIDAPDRMPALNAAAGAAVESSVVNERHQGWDVPKLFTSDGSVLASGGVVNPGSAISALALPAAGLISEAEPSGTARPRAAA